MHSSRPVALAAACLLLAALAPAAQAALPKTKTNKIVPGKSVAGVELGMKMKRAAKVWKMEEGSSCFQIFGSKDLSCMFELMSSSANYNTGNISYEGQKGKTVKRIVIEAPDPGTGPDFSSKMNRYKTSKGVGIGATKRKLSNEFGNKLKRKGSIDGYTTYQVAGPKKAKTIFIVYGGRVEEIQLTVG